MFKRRNIVLILLFLAFVMLFATRSNANVEYTRTIPSNEGTIILNLTGLELSESKQYEFSLVVKGGTPENWFPITNFTESTANIELSSGTKKIVDVLKVTDNGQLFVKEKDATNYIVERLNVDLKLPYLQSLAYKDEDVRYDLMVKLYGAIGNKWGDFSNENTLINVNKVTDKTLLNNFLKIKNTSGNIIDLEEELPICPNTNYYNVEMVYKDKYNDGLYLIWVKRTGEGCKDVYSCIVHDGLENATTVEEYLGTTPSSPEEQGNKNTAPTGDTTGNTQSKGSGTTSAGKTDPTQSSKILPNTGKSIAIVGAILLVILLGTAGYVKYRTYKDIK